MLNVLAQAADDQFALTLCAGAIVLSATIMFLTPMLTRMSGQIRLHQPEQTPEWSAGSISAAPAREIQIGEKAA